MRSSHHRMNRPGRRWKGDLSQMDPISRTCLKSCAKNLLGVHEFTPSFTLFLVHLLNRDSRRLLTKYFKEITKGKVEGDKRGRGGRRDSLDIEHVQQRIMEVADADGGVARRAIEAKLAVLVDSQDAGYAGSKSADMRLRELQTLFKLTAADVAILCFLYCCKQDHQLNNMSEGQTFWSLTELMATATGLRTSKVRQSLSASANLSRSGLIVKDRRGPFSESFFEPAPEILDYLSGMGPIGLARKYCKPDNRIPHALHSFTVPEPSVEIMKSLLKADGPAQILLYGQAGTGKTEFSRAIVAEAGREAFFVQYGEATDERRNAAVNRRIAIVGATGAVRPDNAVLIVDEADRFLNTRYFVFGSDAVQEKGWLNDFLDRCRHKIIWIVNETAYIEESTLRRFSYSLRFRKFTRQERQNIWQKLARKHPLRRFLAPELLKELADRYQANAAGIASAMKALKTILPPEEADPATVKRTLADLLERHLEATGHDPREKLDHLTGNYDIGALHTDTAPERVLQSLRAFADFIRGDTGRDKRHVNLLFWGPPGTGKTEFAKYLADQLSMGLLVKRASDLLSMWVGGTEMQIRAAFEEAERERAILLIDEADSMFINRETAVRSWETAQTNELLTQMENFRGILICCTNLLQHLDRAVVRRFAWKVEFKPLTNEGKVRLFDKYFAEGGRSLSSDHAAQLAAVADLTAGDFKAVWDRYAFVPGRKCADEMLVEELRKEVAYRKGRKENLGFGG